MSSSPAPKNTSPFAARASTRPSSAAEAAPPAPAPATAPAAAPKKSGGGRFVAVGAVVLLAAVAGLWAWNRGDAGAAGVAPAKTQVSLSNGAKAVPPLEDPAAKAARLAEAFAAMQAREATLAFDAAERAALAEATFRAAQARTRADSRDFVAAIAEWEKALAGAGPLVHAKLSARYDAEAEGLREVRLEELAEPSAQALLKAREAAGEAARRNDWPAAVAAREEALRLLPAARAAVAAQLAEVAAGAVARGDLAMATLFHERALRIEPGLRASRDHLYRHKFRAGQTLRTTSGLELAYVPPGEFFRGSPLAEPGRDADEAAQRVGLTKGFFLAVNETTQREWDRVMGAGEAARTLRAAKAGAELISPDLPMHSITWAQAAEYCRRLSELEQASFRLPTEAEWEHACRAGTRSAFNLGVDGLSARDANIDDGSAGVPLAPRPPGVSGPANAWGLRDMHGNVWEWCSDWSAPYPASGGVTDPQGPERDALGRIDLALRVVRGGGWNAPAKDARSANRWEYAPDVATTYIGLRVAQDPDLTRP